MCCWCRARFGLSSCAASEHRACNSAATRLFVCPSICRLSGKRLARSGVSNSSDTSSHDTHKEEGTRDDVGTSIIAISPPQISLLLTRRGLKHEHFVNACWPDVFYHQFGFTIAKLTVSGHYPTLSNNSNDDHDPMSWPAIFFCYIYTEFGPARLLSPAQLRVSLSLSHTHTHTLTCTQSSRSSVLKSTTTAAGTL